MVAVAGNLRGVPETEVHDERINPIGLASRVMRGNNEFPHSFIPIRIPVIS